MRSYRTFYIITVLIAAWPVAGQASGLPVVDIANLAENIRHLVQMELAYARQLEELQRAMEQVEAVTGHYGAGKLLNSGAFRDARRYTPSSWQDTLKILKAGGLPGSVADLRAIYRERAEATAVIGAEQYNRLNTDAANAQAFERRRDTNYATLAIAEATYDDSEARIANYEALMAEIEASVNLKASSDLSARIAAQNGTSLTQLIRLQAVELQQLGAIEAQQLVDETNMKRQTSYEDYPFGALPTE